MIKREDVAVMKGIALCHKPYLRVEEAMIYCDLGRTQLAKKLEYYGIYKNSSGYYAREDLDKMMSGGPTKIEEKVKKYRRF